jgi:hypothetical protein
MGIVAEAPPVADSDGADCATPQPASVNSSPVSSKEGRAREESFKEEVMWISLSVGKVLRDDKPMVAQRCQAWMTAW